MAHKWAIWPSKALTFPIGTEHRIARKVFSWAAEASAVSCVIDPLSLSQCPVPAQIFNFTIIIMRDFIDDNLYAPALKSPRKTTGKRIAPSFCVNIFRSASVVGVFFFRLLSRFIFTTGKDERTTKKQLQ